MRWCPSPDCNNAIKVQYVEARPVTCKCMHTFCFQCGENWHDPVRCNLLKRWIKKCDDDSETSNWIAANTKVGSYYNIYTKLYLITNALCLQSKCTLKTSFAIYGVYFHLFEFKVFIHIGSKLCNLQSDTEEISILLQGTSVGFQFFTIDFAGLWSSRFDVPNQIVCWGSIQFFSKGLTDSWSLAFFSS